MNAKECTICGQVKPLSDFRHHRTNKDRRRGACRICSGKQDAIRRRRYRIDAINAYGGECECCGESRQEFLNFDHKDGGGSKARRAEPVNATASLCMQLKKAGYPKGEIRILCHNCNSAMGYYGYCPHQLNGEERELRMDAWVNGEILMRRGLE